MSRIQTQFTGITSNDTYADGDCLSMVNLRNKNGALKPVPPRKIMHNLGCDYSLVYVHKTTVGESWIGVVNNNDNTSEVYYDIFGAYDIRLENDSANIQPGAVYETANGLLLKVRTGERRSDGYYYAVCTAVIDSPTLDSPSIRGTLRRVSGSGEDYLPYTGYYYYPRQIIIKNPVDYTIHSVEQIGNTLSFVSSGTVSYALYSEHQYRYLGELPEIPLATFSTVMYGEEFSKDYATEYPGINEKSDITQLTRSLINQIKKEINDSDCGLCLYDAHFIRYAYRLYDGSLIKHSAPILIMPEDYIFSLQTMKYEGPRGAGILKSLNVKGYKVNLALTSSDLSEWKDIITSIDVFMSPPLGILPTDETPEISYINPGSRVFDKLRPEAIENIETNGLFYLVESFTDISEELNRTNLPRKEGSLALGSIDSLLQRERMVDESFSHHSAGASVSYVYNSRLHLADIHTRMYSGFHYGFFHCDNRYNGTEKGNKTNDRPPIEEELLKKNYIIEVEIQSGSNLQKVYSRYTPIAAEGVSMYTSAFISYPDRRATKMTFYGYNDDGERWDILQSIRLKPHASLELAYYLHDDLKALKYNVTGDTHPLDMSKPAVIHEPNKIKVSALNNPIQFPNLTVYQAGTGDILALESNVMNVSDRNFGAYPVYVFTTNGIYVMTQGGESVLYSTITPTSSREVPVSPVVCATPYGIVFAGRRGLFIANGNETTLITPQLEQQPVDIRLESHHAIDNVVHMYNTPLLGYLQGLSDMIYNPYENELIIINRAYPYNFVLSFDTQTMYQSTERIGFDVKNTYPKLIVVEGRNFKDFSQIETESTHISLTTRPMRYGSPDIKRLERMIVRGEWYNVINTPEGKQGVIAVQHSNDGINFGISRGLHIPPGNLKDMDTGAFAGIHAGYFVFEAGAVVDNQSIIRTLEATLEE